MKRVNFIKGRYDRLQLMYIGVDILFLAMIAFCLMFIVSWFMSMPIKEDKKVGAYIQTKVNTLSRSVKDYPSIKKEKERLLDLSIDLEEIKKSQYFSLTGLEKISQSITDGVYLEKLTYNEDAEKGELYGQAVNLKLLSLFIENLETNFNLKRVELVDLGTEKQGKRGFTLSVNFNEKNLIQDSANDRKN